MIANVNIGPIPNRSVQVEVDGFEPEPYVICPLCHRHVPAAVYYEVGCRCEYVDMPYTAG